MERSASWFPLAAVLLIVVGLVTLAAPPPAQAMDPQLAIALASAAGAIALIVGYLIVANSRDKERAASFEGTTGCTEAQAGPMGCSTSAKPVEVAPTVPSTDGPMAADPRSARGETLAGAAGPMAADGRTAARIDPPGVCPAGQVAGPMGCGAGSNGSPAPYSAPTSAPAPSAPAPFQGQ